LLLACLVSPFIASPLLQPQAGGDPRQVQPSGQYSQDSLLTLRLKTAEMRMALQMVTMSRNTPAHAPRARQIWPGSEETAVLDVTEMFCRCSAVAAEAASLARPPLSCHLDLVFALMLQILASQPWNLFVFLLILEQHQ